jgi:hypothetical protein
MILFCAMLSGFFLVEMSIDRLIAVRFPMSAPRFCTRSRAIKTVIVTTVLVVIFNLQLPFVLDYVKDSVTGKDLCWVVQTMISSNSALGLSWR